MPWDLRGFRGDEQAAPRRGDEITGRCGRAAARRDVRCVTLLGMGRYVLAGLVVVAESLLLPAVHQGDPPLWAMAGHPAAVIAIIALRRRAPIPAYAAALALGAATGAGHVLLLWISYQTGRSVVSRGGTAAVVAVALASLALRPAAEHPVHVIVFFLVFLALPLLVGRYVAQHERLVAALEAGNRRLRRERELLAERERLRERLRIARDMHDSLGHRLGLVAIQAAALEVAPLPPEQATAVRRLAASARAAVDELHELVGALRTTDEEPSGPGVAGIAELVGEYRAAGVPVTLHRRGEPRPLPAAADPVAYRVVEEGLTNAARHAPGRPVTVTLDWEPDALLIEVVNPLPAVPAGTGEPERGGPERGGHGLRGLRERVAPIGGLLGHRRSGGSFRLFAMLPLDAAPAPADRPAEPGPVPSAHGSPPAGAAPHHAGVPGDPLAAHRPAALRRELSAGPAGAALAFLLFVLLPAFTMAGVGG